MSRSKLEPQQLEDVMDKGSYGCKRLSWAHNGYLDAVLSGVCGTGLA